MTTIKGKEKPRKTFALRGVMISNFPVSLFPLLS